MKPLAELTNHELNEVFCIEALGWTKDSSGDETVWLNAAGKYTCGIYDVEFAQSLDAVMPWLEKCENVVVVRTLGGWRISLEKPTGDWFRRCVHSESIARAAVIALIEAARMKKGTE